MSTKKPKKRWKRCSRCGERKPDVKERPDNYAREIWNEDETWVACDDCDDERNADI